jgi:transposase
MFFPDAHLRVWLYGEPVDMRKSFDGLYALARNGLKQDPLQGALFAFVNYAHDHGGLLFYMVKTVDALGKLSTWRTQLTSGGYTCTDCGTNKLAFYATHKLQGSGIDFKVRSMAVSLYHQPLDKSARNSAAKRVAKKAPAKVVKKAAPKVLPAKG